MSESKLKITRPEDYASLKAPTDKEAGELVQMPSGAVFRLRRADIQGMVAIGELPQSLVNEGLKAWQSQGIAPDAEPKEIEEELSPEETISRLIFLRQTVVENCLEPTIGYDESGVVSLLNGEGKAVAKLKSEDFLYAFKWITYQEGALGLSGLSRFRNRQERRAATSGAHSKRRRVPSEQPS